MRLIKIAPKTVYVAIVKILKKTDKKFRMQEFQWKKKEYIIAAYRKKDAIVKNHFAKKNIANALIQGFYVPKLANVSTAGTCINNNKETMISKIMLNRGKKDKLNTSLLTFYLRVLATCFSWTHKLTNDLPFINDAICI